MDQEEFNQLKPNHKYLSERYGHTTQPATLKFNKEFRQQYLTMIDEDIREYNT